MSVRDFSAEPQASVRRVIGRHAAHLCGGENYPSRCSHSTDDIAREVLDALSAMQPYDVWFVDPPTSEEIAVPRNERELNWLRYCEPWIATGVMSNEFVLELARNWVNSGQIARNLAQYDAPRDRETGDCNLCGHAEAYPAKIPDTAHENDCPWYQAKWWVRATPPHE